ncbi:group II intron reverse transcriptase/maturase [Deinococcus caeni]
MPTSGRISPEANALGNARDMQTGERYMDDRRTSHRSATEAMKAAKPTIESWAQIPWRKLEGSVYRLQKRIYRASQSGNKEAVHSLQRLLMKSEAARLLAVRRVTQDNQGKKTAGVDGVKALSPKDRLKLAEELKNHQTFKPKPTRRVWIPKPGKDERRPLGIPTMRDRAHQALVKLAMEPEWEAQFEPNSYGFRPSRGAHDAIEAIQKTIVQRSKFVLDADIKGCFDNIDHNALLDKLGTFPALRRAIKAWLKAGVMEGVAAEPTDRGTPQGGVISPLLANVALHGMETAIHEVFNVHESRSLTVVRYADDFVILFPTLEGIHRAQKVVVEWLAGVGLHLNAKKTRIVHTLNDLDDEPAGFDFLGFNVRQYPVGVHHSGKAGGRKVLGFKTHIKPSKAAISRHYEKLAAFVRANRNLRPEGLIRHLNLQIRGWCAYYRTVVSKAVFTRLDHLMFSVLRHWCNYRHPQKNRTWIQRKYWKTIGDNQYRFVSPEGIALVLHASTPIGRHVKVKGTRSPFDGDLVYWAYRLKDHPLTSGTKARLIQRQWGRCKGCGLVFRPEDLLETDHVVPTSLGGSDKITNKAVYHRHCHDTKTARDGSTSRPRRTEAQDA